MEKQIKLSKDHQDELLYGRAGYLWTCLFLNKHFGKDTIPVTSTVGHALKASFTALFKKRAIFFFSKKQRYYWIMAGCYRERDYQEWEKAWETGRVPVDV